jgi:CRISPR-associated protein Cas1
MTVARKFIDGAAFNMVKNLKYYNNRGKDLEPLIENIEKYMQGIENTYGNSFRNGLVIEPRWN